MPIKYTTDELLEKLNYFLSPGQIPNLYVQEFLNWTGFVEGGTEKYTEVIAECLIKPQNLNLLRGIPHVKREGSYCIAEHQHTEYDPKAIWQEEHLARSMMCKSFGGLGKVIDYQTPLKNTRDGKGREIGKIDLLSYNDKMKRLYIIEFKRPDSSETLLRCILEAYTYWRNAFHEKLLSDFSLPACTKISKAVLIYEGSKAADDFHADKKIKELLERVHTI